MQESTYLECTAAMIEKFQHLPLMANLGPRHIQKILSLSKLRKYSSGEDITTEGNTDRWMYILISGKVQVLKHGNSLATIDQIGETFGEMAAIDGSSRSATIRAINDTVCLATDLAFVDKLPQPDRNAFTAIFFRMFAEIISQRLRETSNDLTKTKEELSEYKKKEAQEKRAAAAAKKDKFKKHIIK